MQPSYGYGHRYPQEQQQQHQQQQQKQQQQQQQQQPTPFSANSSSPGEPESFPAPFPSISSEHFPPSSILLPGRSPFVPQPSFPPPPPPRRPKSHVASACVNCKKAHLACDTRRPCPRCVGLGKQETCVDVQHKKRGRPRLRDDTRAHSFEISQMQRPGVYSSPSSPSAMAPSARGGPHRVLKSQHDAPRFYRRQSLQEDLLSRASNYSDQRGSQRPLKISLPPITNATAYLTTELLVAKSTESMRELLGYRMVDLDGQKSLFDIVLDTDRGKVEQLVSKIHAEIRERGPREPKQWPPRISTMCAAIQTITENQIFMGMNTYDEMLHLRRPDGNYIRIRIRAQLASASFFFVIMAFSLANEMPPPLQLSHSTSYGSLHSLRNPTPNTAPLHSPSFLTSSSHLQIQSGGSGPSGRQSPYSHPGMSLTSPMESRPRTLQYDPAYPPPPPLSQHTNPSPSPVTTTFYRPTGSPAAITPTGSTFPPPPQQERLQQERLQQSDLQLPPLKMNSLPDYGYDNNNNRIVEGRPITRHVEIPARRERIGVREMLE